MDQSQARVSHLAHRLARQAGIPHDDADELVAAAMLHRIGRLGLPDPRPGNASGNGEAERRLPEIGARILGGSRLRLLERAAELALCHQERWDGSGYPRGLAGRQIPRGARVVALAAGFDALVIDGDPAVPASPEWVATRLAEEAGRAFDPELVQILLADLPAMLALRSLAHPPLADEPPGCVPLAESAFPLASLLS